LAGRGFSQYANYHTCQLPIAYSHESAGNLTGALKTTIDNFIFRGTDDFFL